MPIQYLNERLEQLHSKMTGLVTWSEEMGVKHDFGYSLAYLSGRDPMGSAPDSYLSPLLKYLKENVAEGAKLLEIGAGAGRFTIPLAKAGYYVDAVEPAGTGLETIAKRAKDAGVEDRVRCLCGAYDDLPKLEDKSYDACLALQSIMYCDELATVKGRVSELCRIAKSSVVFDVVSKYGYIVAGVLDAPATFDNVRAIYEQARMPGEDTHNKERLCFATYDETVALAKDIGLTESEILPVDYATVMRDRVPASDQVAVDEFLRADPKLRDSSLFILVMAKV